MNEPPRHYARGVRGGTGRYKYSCTCVTNVGQGAQIQMFSRVEAAEVARGCGNGSFCLVGAGLFGVMKGLELCGIVGVLDVTELFT